MSYAAAPGVCHASVECVHACVYVCVCMCVSVCNGRKGSYIVRCMYHLLMLEEEK